MRNVITLFAFVSIIVVAHSSPMVNRREREISTHSRPVQSKPRKLALKKFTSNAQNRNMTHGRGFNRKHVQKFTVAKEKQVAYMGNTGNVCIFRLYMTHSTFINFKD